jgi:hypothetical protein
MIPEIKAQAAVGGPARHDLRGIQDGSSIAMDHDAPADHDGFGPTSLLPRSRALMFARRSRRVIPISMSSSRRGRRPSLARRPSLELERCDQRTLLSISLVSVDAAGTGAANGLSDTFDQALEADTAEDAANYQDHQVTLTLRSKLRPGQMAQLDIEGTPGGVASAAGIPLNSPGGTKPGQDDLTTVALAARRS